jgi:MFS family permease
MSASEIIVQSWDFYKKNWKQVFSYIGCLIVFCISYALLILGVITLYYLAGHIFSWQAYLVINLLLGGGLLVAALWALTWVNAAYLHIFKNSLEHKSITPLKRALEEGGQHVWSIVWVNILMGLIIFGGSLLFIFPGIIFTVWYYFAVYETVFFNKRGTKALAGSKQLVLGRTGQVLWRILIPVLVFAIPLILAEFIGSAIVSFGGNFALVLGVGFSVGVNILVAPIILIASLILYLDLKHN